MSLRILLALVVVAACDKSKGAPGPDPRPPPPVTPVDGPRLPLPPFDDPPKEPGPPRPTQISMGDYHGCARMSDDTMRCWGDNGSHQLGVDPYQHPRGAVATPPISGVVQVAAGKAHTCARRRDRTIWCWGHDIDGVGKSYRDRPTQIAGITDAVDLDAGDLVACVVRRDGSVWCWGDNASRQLGDGTDQARRGPVQALIHSATQISVAYGACARRADGSVWCWGGANSGPPAPAPVKDVIRVALAGTTTCAVKTTGELFCWGENDGGQLGRPASDDDGPGPVPGLAGVTWVTVGPHLACAVAGGTPYCWGEASANPAFPPDCLRLTRRAGGAGAGDHGAVEDWEYCPVPTPIKEVTDAVAVEASWMTGTCALTRQGEVHCWGKTVEKLAL